MAEKHFYEQIDFTKKYLLPYFRKYVPEFQKLSVFEIGCAEGGLLEVLQNMGIDASGVEISNERVKIAQEKNPNLKITVGDITDPDLPAKLNRKFDFIIMREVIEHIYKKKAAFDNINELLNENGYLFISFPPKFSPFAGHQQIGKSFLKTMPYLHLVPAILLRPTAKLFGENDGYVDEIKLHFSTGCSIRELENQYRAKNFSVVKKEFFFFRPVYLVRFGLPIFRLPGIPILREIISFGCESLLQKKSV